MQTYNYYNEKLEREADCLLAKEHRNGHPHYSNARLGRKCTNERMRRNSLRPPQGPEADAVAWIHRRTLRSVLLQAQLTRRQREVLLHKANGETWVEIGLRFGTSKQAAQRIFSQAVGRIRTAWRANKYAGLAEVYRAEVRRYFPRRR